MDCKFLYICQICFLSLWSCLYLFIQGVCNWRSVPALASWQLLYLCHLDRLSEPVGTCQSVFTHFPFLWNSYLTPDSRWILFLQTYFIYSPHVSTLNSLLAISYWLSYSFLLSSLSAKAFLVSFCVSILFLPFSFLVSHLSQIVLQSLHVASELGRLSQIHILTDPLYVVFMPNKDGVGVWPPFIG